MAVRVITTRRNLGDGTTIEDNLDTGETVSVLDGHLYVYDDAGDITAVYAPGSWASMVVSKA